MDSSLPKKVIRKCTRCGCPGHRNTCCPIFMPKEDNEFGYIKEIKRIKNLKLIPISNVKYLQKWIENNGGSSQNMKLIYEFIQNQEIFDEDDDIINDYFLI